jgi:hypothetical protein
VLRCETTGRRAARQCGGQLASLARRVMLFTTSTVEGLCQLKGFVATGRSRDHHGENLDEVRFERQIDQEPRRGVTSWLIG